MAHPAQCRYFISGKQKTDPKAGFLFSVKRITWQQVLLPEQQQVLLPELQQEQQRQPEQQQELQQPEQQQELQQQELRFLQLSFHHKRSEQQPAEQQR
ncbi:MAG: hypothetical protein RL210_2338 [Pseudomonadota bacterium]